MTTAIPVPRLTRLEVYTAGQWVTTNACVALLHPERYPERMADKGKVARATMLGETLVDGALLPTGEVYQTPGADLL